jgi:carboxylesterase type B
MSVGIAAAVSLTASIPEPFPSTGRSNKEVHGKTKSQARLCGILFSIAYRLGVFGFMAHPKLSRESGKGSGAYGIQDMIAALQWVKNNIAQ